MLSRPGVLLVLLLVAPLAGCAGRSQEVTVPTPTASPVTTTPTPISGFVIEGLTIRPPDGSARQLREDDADALVRYTVRLPLDAPEQTAFVSYAVDGRVVDVQNVHLNPGESKDYEQTIEELRSRTQVHVQVRAGSAVAEANTGIVPWPRAGESLALGPLFVRVDYGLKEQRDRVLVNVTLQHTGPEVPISDFRVKMVCADERGELTPTGSAHPPVPRYGASRGVDVVVDDCPYLRYGLEFKGNGGEGIEYYGRILLVPPGWAP